MRKGILYTKNGIKELDDDVAQFINKLNEEKSQLSNEVNALKLEVFRLEFKLSRGWFYRTFFT